MSVTYLKAEDIAEEVATRIEAITIANGCETDIGTRLLRGRVKVDDDDLPCATIVEGADNIQEMNASAGNARPRVQQEFIIVGYDNCDPNAPNTTAHKIIRDLKRAIFRTDGDEDSTFGKRVRAVVYLGRDIGPRADGAASVAAAIRIAVEYVEALANP